VFSDTKLGRPAPLEDVLPGAGADQGLGFPMRVSIPSAAQSGV
jgi:hypothetical protein